MPRTTFRDISGPRAIEPVAQPVSTYVRPADPAPSPLHDLAAGLAKLDSGLQNFMAKREAKQADADKIRAEAAFNKNNSMGWSEAVKQGLVPANASPVFMQSYKAAQGNLEGIRLREQFNSEYLSWEGRNSNDPASFQKFLGEFVKRNVQTDDVDVLRGLNPHIEKLWADGHDVFSRDSSKSVYNNSVSTRAALASKTVDAASEQGLTDGKGTDYEKLWADMLAQRQEALSSGIRKEDYDKELVATIAAKAIEHQDPQLLNLLDKKLDDGELAIKDFPEFRAMREDAISKLSTIARQQIADEEKKQSKEDKKREEELTAATVRILAQDPSQQIPEELLKQWEKYDPLARKKVAEIRKSLADDQTFEDPDELLRIQRDIAGGEVTRTDIIQMIEQGKIRNPSTFTSLLDRVEKVQKNARDGTGILTLQTTKRYTKTISDRMKPAGIEADIFGNVALTNEGLEAINDFETMLMEWEDKNPNAPQFDREKFIKEAGDLVLGRIDENVTDANDPNKYKSDAQIAQEKFREQSANTPTPGTTQESETLKLYSSDKPPMLDRLPDEQFNYLKERAAELGISPEELNQEVWQTIKDRGKADQSLPKVPTTVDQLNKELQQPTSMDATENTSGQLQRTSLGIDQLGENIGNLIQTAYQAETPSAPTAFDAILTGQFEDPMSSPKVDPAVVAKYSGKKRVPVAIRNNNPAAISIIGDEMSSFAAQQPGYVGKTKRPANEGGYYAKFATPEAGINAASVLLERYGRRGIDTTDAIVKKWSTDSNAWGVYSRTLQRYLQAEGFDVDGSTQLDLSDPKVRMAILMAKSAHEAGAGRPTYLREVYERAMRGELGIDTTPTAEAAPEDNPTQA